MTSDFLPGLLAFATVATVTPGPNTLMVMASTANFGIPRTLPHMLGITGGFAAMVALVGLGLEQLFDTLPWLETGMRAVAFLFLLYLAWKIARSAPTEDGARVARPLTAWGAAAFQWVNPKAWAMALSAHALHAPGDGIGAALAVAGTFGAVSLPCLALWMLAGARLRRLLARRRHRQVFNGLMAGLLVASMAPALLAG